MDNLSGPRSASEAENKAGPTASENLDPNEDDLDDLDGTSCLLSAFRPY